MRLLWIEQAVADAPLPNLQGAVFRAQGDPALGLGLAGKDCPLDPGAHRRRLRRTAENVEALVQDFRERTESRPMNLITSDEYKPYRQAILRAYGEEVTPKPTGKPGRPKASYYKPSPSLRYATVHKTRKKGRVVKIGFRVVFGTVAAVMAPSTRRVKSVAVMPALPWPRLVR